LNERNNKLHLTCIGGGGATVHS